MGRKLRDFICECCLITFSSKGKNVRFCSNSCRAKIVNPQKGKPHVNRKCDRIRYCLTCGKQLHHQSKNGYCKEHYSTAENTRLKRSIAAKKAGVGGYKQGSGRGKNGWYNGHWCDSSWELAWIIYMSEHNLVFKRNTTKFPYTINGKIKNFIPDFIIEDNSYIEIKGFESEVTNAKIQSFPHTIKVLYKDDMKLFLDYAIQRYGKNFISLYN